MTKNEALEKHREWLKNYINKSIELKPCPFCGGKATIVDNDNSEWKVFCTNPDCDAQYGWCADKDYTIRGWNKRTGKGRK